MLLCDNRQKCTCVPRLIYRAPRLAAGPHLQLLMLGPRSAVCSNRFTMGVSARDWMNPPRQHSYETQQAIHTWHVLRKPHAMHAHTCASPHVMAASMSTQLQTKPKRLQATSVNTGMMNCQTTATNRRSKHTLHTHPLHTMPDSELLLLAKQWLAP